MIWGPQERAPAANGAMKGASHGHALASIAFEWSDGLGLQAVGRKLAGYPERAKRNMHHANCRIPARLAHVLHEEPQLVAPAVEAFYARDAASMKAASRMQNFPPQVCCS